jgi:hypothetical protein
MANTQSSASAQDSPPAPRHKCAGCGAPCKRLAPLHGAKTGPELRALPLMGPCCNPRLRPRGGAVGDLSFAAVQ